MTVVGALALLAAGVLLWLLGRHAGRTAEQRRLNSGVIQPGEISPVQVFEAELRRAVGAHRMHPDPENAPRVRQARILR